MTYILGARCIDGVVLIGDTKVIRGDTDVSYEYKIIHPLPSVVVGASGASGVFHKFLINMMKKVEQQTKDGQYPADRFITDCEDNCVELTERYFPRIKDTIEVLIAYRVGNLSSLYILNPVGVAEPVTNYLAIGHGEPYGSFFLKKYWKPNITMEEAAKIGCFIIKYIESFTLDNSVGGDISQIWFLPDLPVDFDNLPEEEKKKFEIRQVSTEELDVFRLSIENVAKVNKFFNTFNPFSLG